MKDFRVEITKARKHKWILSSSFVADDTLFDISSTIITSTPEIEERHIEIEVLERLKIDLQSHQDNLKFYYQDKEKREEDEESI